jgi:hypothetical protein
MLLAQAPNLMDQRGQMALDLLATKRHFLVYIVAMDGQRIGVG